MRHLLLENRAKESRKWAFRQKKRTSPAKHRVNSSPASKHQRNVFNDNTLDAFGGSFIPDLANNPGYSIIHRMDARPGRLILRAAMSAATILVLIVTISSATAANDFGDSLTRNAIRLSLFCYAGTLFLMMRIKAYDWTGSTVYGALTRCFWTAALFFFLVHFTLAFHYFHHWSHKAAFEHSRVSGGLGEGIYFSYLFTVLWLFDVAWWWLRPAAYAGRSPWIGRGLHTYLLFIVLNGTVVFESGYIRWAGLVTFAGLAMFWLQTIGQRRSAT